MWWDYSQITIWDSVLFSVISILTLYVVGCGTLHLIFFVSKKNPFSSMSFFVRANISIFFGFIFIFLICYVFSVFNVAFLISVIVVILLAVFGLLISHQKIKLRFPKKVHFQQNSGRISVLFILLTIVFLSSTLIGGLYGSTNDDGADHTLMVRIILDNPDSLFTRSAQPYGDFFIKYPSATHVFCAFFVSFLGVSIEKIVLLLSFVLPCLIALSFYSSIKCLFDNNLVSFLGLLLSAFFTIGLSWAPMSWGGLPVLLSFYISISGIGLIYALSKNKITPLTALLMGLVFFIALQTYPTAVLILTFWFLLILCANLVQRFRVFHMQSSALFSLKRNDLLSIIVFLLPITASFPYLYSYYVNNIAGRFVLANTTLNSVSSVTSEIVKTKISFNWLLDIPHLSLFFSEFGLSLSLASLSLLIIILLVSPVNKRLLFIFQYKSILPGLLLIYFLTIILLSYISLTIFLPVKLLLNLFDPARVWQHFFIPATFLSAVVLSFFIKFLYFCFKVFNKKTGSFWNRIIACVFLALLIMSTFLVSIPVISEQHEVYNKTKESFDTYKSLNKDDLLLMNWIVQNVPPNSLILVSAGDSGQFVSSVTQRLSISKYSSVANYTDLMLALTSNASDSRAVPLLIEHNVTYVYIGSTSTTFALQIPDYRQFNATQFEICPYFTLTHHVGDSWLFEFNASKALESNQFD